MPRANNSCTTTRPVRPVAPATATQLTTFLGSSGRSRAFGLEDAAATAAEAAAVEEDDEAFEGEAAAVVVVATEMMGLLKAEVVWTRAATTMNNTINRNMLLLV